MAQASTSAGLRPFFYPFGQFADFSEANSMIRSLCFLAALLLDCTLLAAPAPQPKPFVSGWDVPVDPDGDCKIRRNNGVLTIEMPGSDHDYNPLRKRFNAPRLFREREIEGEFVMQVRVRIDCQPSVQSTVDGQPSSVSAGFLVMLPHSGPLLCIRVEFRASRKGSGVHGFFDVRRWGHDKRQGGRIVEGAKGPQDEWNGDAYLRLERQDGNLGVAISSDGENWKGGGIMGIRERLKVGLAAYSTSTESSKVVFDQLTIRHGEKKRNPWEFVSGWGNPIDPDKDCKIQRDRDALTIAMPGTDHDYDPVRKRFNAPQLISDLEGEFDVQVRVRIDSRLSVQSTVKGQPSFVSAGFLLIYPEPQYSICDRLEYAVSQQGSRLDGYAVSPRLAEPRRKEPVSKDKERDGYAVMKTWVGAPPQKGDRIQWDLTKWDHERPALSGNVLWERGWQEWPLSEKAESAYLRLDHRVLGRSNFYISPDGEKWTRLGSLPHVPQKCKVGLAAFSTSTEPAKVIFDQLKLARDKKKDQ